MAGTYDGAKLRSLDGLLQQWEHYLTWLNCLRLIFRKKEELLGPFPRVESPALDNCDQLRKYLLSVHQVDPYLRSIGNFAWPEPLTEDAVRDDTAVGALATLPKELAQWSLCSRRVYHINEDLQAVLTATDFGDLTWNDVYLPHESYAVRLDRPIQLARGDKSSLMLLTRCETSSSEDVRFIVRAIGDLSADFRRNDSQARRNFYDFMRQGDFSKAIAVVNEQVEKVRIFGVCFTVPSLNTSDSVQDMLKEMMKHEGVNLVFDDEIAEENDVEKSLSVLDQIVRILVGLALYFKTIPNRESKPSSWDGVKTWGKPDARVITNDSKICHVQCRYVLSDIERAFLGLGGNTVQFDMSWKFVRGYWRRPSGKGHDPDAVKTVHVRPYMIRRDRMPDKGLPGGASQNT